MDLTKKNILINSELLNNEIINIFEYNRIIIVGNNGSGKSFLSKELAVITSLPLIHLDALYWRPNWGKPSNEEWIKSQTELISKEKWIIDGNHSNTMELRFQAADLIIFLDIKRIICMAGVLKRYGKKRSDMPEYLEERIDIGFYKGLWNFPTTRKPIIMNLHKKYPNKMFLVIKSRREINSILTLWKNHKFFIL